MEIRKKLNEDPDFIYSKRFGNSLKQLLVRYPTGAPTKVIAQVLLLDEEQVQEIYQSIVEKLQKAMLPTNG